MVVTAYVINVRLTTSAWNILEHGGTEESNDTWTFYDLGEDLGSVSPKESSSRHLAWNSYC